MIWFDFAALFFKIMLKLFQLQPFHFLRVQKDEVFALIFATQTFINIIIICYLNCQKSS